MPELSKAAKSGSRRDTLLALRDTIAAAIDSTESGRDIAALSKRLLEVMAEIDALPDETKQTALQRARNKSKR